MTSTSTHRTILATALAAAAFLPASAQAAAPDNDAFARAALVKAVPATVSGTLRDATFEPGEPKPPTATGSVWYAYNPSAAARIVLWVDEAAARVYTGESLAQLEQVADVPAATRVPLSVTGGRRYWIAVTGDGDFGLSLLRGVAPSNDLFAGARPLSVGVTRGNLGEATTELGEPAHSGAAAAHSVWYRFRARRDDRMTIDTSDTGCQTRLAAYTGGDLGALEEVASNTFTGDPTPMVSTIRFEAEKGRTYFVAVDCTEPGRGDFVLGVSDQGIAGKGVKLAIGPDQTLSTVLRRGLHVVVSTRRHVRLGMELVVSKATARRLGLEQRVLGRSSGFLDFGQSMPAAIPVSQVAKRALRGERALHAVIRLTLLRGTAADRTKFVPVDLAG